MKRIELTLVAILACLFATAQKVDNTLTQSVFNCGRQLRQIVNNSTVQHSVASGGRVFSDTIKMYSRLPYVSKVSETVMAYAKIGLDAYYIKAGLSDSINYDELYSLLRRSRKVTSLHDLSYALCCLSVGQYCHEQSLFRAEANIGECYALANKTIFGENSKPYFQSMMDASTAFSLAGKYHEADSCIAFCQGYMEKEDSTETYTYRTIIQERAQYCQAMGDIDKALELYNKLVALSAGMGDEEVIALIDRAGLCYESLSNYKQSNSDVTKAIAIMAESNIFLPNEVLNIFPLLNNPYVENQPNKLLELVNDNYHDGEFITTALMSRACQADRKYNKADYYYDKAIKLAKLSSDGSCSGLKENETAYLQNLLMARCEYGVLEKCISHDIDEMLNSPLKSSPVVISMMTFLSNINSLDGKYSQASGLQRGLLKLKSLSDDERKQLLNSLGDNELAIGNFQEAYRVGKELIRCGGLTDDQFYRIQSSLIVNSLISEIDLRQTNYQDISQGGTDSLIQKLKKEVNVLTDFIVKRIGKESPQYVESLMNTMTIDYLDKNFANMESTARYCEQIINQFANSKDRVCYLKALATDYFMAKKYNKALELIRIKGDDKYSPMPWYDTLIEAESCLKLGKSDEAKAAFTKSANEIIRTTLKSFTTLRQSERDYFWRMYRQWLYDSGKYVKSNDEESEFTGSLYNLSLFSKGLLLHSKQEIERVIRNSGNTALYNVYQRLTSIRTRLTSSSLSEVEKEGLEEEANLCEDSIMRGCVSYGNYTRQLTADWKQLQKVLNDSTTAIEFILFNTDDTTKCYAALILEKESRYPRFIRLFKENEIDSIASGDMISQKYSQLIWSPLLPYIKGKKNIFFSPTGLLNKIPIEFLPYEGSDMSLAFNIYRLSSTRMLLENHAHEQLNNLVAYGGLEYDATLENSKKTNINNKRLFHFPYLDGTEKEVTDIASIAKADNIKCNEILGENGTEESFKNLSGKPFQLLHIGTHGFCKSFKTKYLDDLPILTNGNLARIEDKSLYYSGLAMAGVNNATVDSETSNSNEGYLSAKEISLMDLSNVGLAVLSACNTNNGDVTGDGTFGLQRGFKLAGVKALIMTAWSVSDKATSIFICNFYKHLLGGNSLFNSFNAARAELRKTNGGIYDKPQYWAPFILLDGIN